MNSKKQNNELFWRGGFTLIELLVVVAIIALLVSVLLPALSAAREQARSAYCLSNLKQQGTAILYYAGDYGDYLPTYGIRKNGMTGIYEAGNEYLKRLDPYVKRARPTTAAGRDATNIWRCPSDAAYYGKSGHSGKNDATSYMLCAGKTTYCLLSRAFPAGLWLPYKLTDYPCKAKGIFAGSRYDLRDASREVIHLDLTYDNGQNFRHRGGYNVVFIDGHAKWYLEADPSDPNWYLNYTATTRMW